MSVSQVVFNSLNLARDWVSEVKAIAKYKEALSNEGKLNTVREVALHIGKSKTWIQDSLDLARMLNVYPDELDKLERTDAIKFIAVKKRVNRTWKNV